jgi:hypothetical protein
MASVRFEGMYEGVFADACIGKFPLVSMGRTSDPIKRGQTGSEDQIGRADFKKKLST